jgi:excinuclease ABC subunit B
MLDIYSSIEDMIYRIHFDEETIIMIEKKNPITWENIGTTKQTVIWPATQFMQNMNDIDKIIKQIKQELKERVEYFKKRNELVFAQRIQQKVEYDMKMLKET